MPALASRMPTSASPSRLQKKQPRTSTPSSPSSSRLSPNSRDAPSTCPESHTAYVHLASKPYLKLTLVSLQGRYLPVFASAVYDSNARAKAENRTEINLKSVLIGNGLTSHADMWPAYIDVMCSGASVPAILDIGTCVALKRAVRISSSPSK